MIATKKQYFKNYLKRNTFIRNLFIDYLELKTFFKSQMSKNLDIYDHEIVESLKVKGFAVIKSFFSFDDCQRLIDSTNKILQTKETNLTNGDLRSFGAEQNNFIKKKYSANKKIKHIMHNYLGTTPEFDSTLAAKLTFIEGNLGSGQGWHRDSYTKQIKSILYLSDVTEAKGPFEYIIGSNSKNRVKRDSKFLSSLHDGGYNGVRFNHEDIKLLCKEFNYKSELVTGNIGDLVIADTRGLHRGHPIINGERMALTNYYKD